MNKFGFFLSLKITCESAFVFSVCVRVENIWSVIKSNRLSLYSIFDIDIGTEYFLKQIHVHQARQEFK